MKLTEIKLKDSKEFWCLWFLLAMPGWFKIIANFSNLLLHKVLSQYLYTQVYLLNWTQVAEVLQKPSEFFQYGVASFFSVFFFIVIYIAFLSKEDSKLWRFMTNFFLIKELDSGYLKLYLFSLAISSLSIICFSGKHYSAFLYSLHLLLFVLPFFVFRKAVINVSNASTLNRGQKKFFYAILGLLLVELFFMFYPFIHGRIFILNDYLDVPEYTMVDGKYVDNASFIRAHKIGKLNKYDPRIDQGRSPKVIEGLSLKTEPTQDLLMFVHKHSDRYFYDYGSRSLQISGHMLANNIENEFYILTLIIGQENLSNLVRMFTVSDQYYNGDEYYKSTVESFLGKNYLELCYQVFPGHYFHHHNYMLSPVNEYFLGKDPVGINFFYGKLSSLILAKAVSLFGGMNFQNYLHASYCFYILYYLICVVVIFAIFRDLGFSILAAVVVYASLHMVGYDSIASAPGFNPLRHFFDLFVILFLYYFTLNNQRRYLVGCLGFAILSVMCNREFGAVILMALIVPLFIYFYAKRSEGSFLNFFIVILGIVLSVLIIAFWYHTDNPMAVYSIIGLGIPVLRFNELILMELALIPFYLFLIKVINCAKNLKYIALYLLVYFQLICIYLVWNPASNHFFSLGAIWGLGIVVFAKMLIDYKWSEGFKIRYLVPITVSVFALFYVPSLFFYYFEKHAYDNIRLTHRVYAWNFERASFDTTMDPSVFAGDIRLINKYVPRDKAIYIISKYDNFLPFLAGKYSAMPYLEVITSLVTQREINNCINVILENRPEYIFVDTDISRNLNGDVFYKNDSFVKMVAPDLWVASSARVKMLKYLREIYYGIQDQYSPAEAGMLVTVYKRKIPPMMRGRD